MVCEETLEAKKIIGASKSEADLVLAQLGFPSNTKRYPERWLREIE